MDNLRDFARHVPGLTVVDQGPRSSSPIMIRGLNLDVLAASEALTNSGGGTVATYFGEVPVYIDLDLVDIERVEVLRGPQGTLYGASSLGGNVRFLPRKPDTESLSVEAHGRTFAIDESDDLSYQADIVVNVPFAGNWAFRGVARYTDRAGWIDQPFIIPLSNVGFVDPEDPASFAGKEDTNDWQRTTLRGGLLWDTTENLSLQLNYNYQKDEIGGRQTSHKNLCENVLSGTSGRTDFTTPPAVGPYPAPAFPTGCSVSDFEYVNAYRVDEPNERENQIWNLDIIWDLGFAELTSATGYTEYTETGQRDQTDLLLNFEYYYADYPTFTAFTLEEFDNTLFTQEIRLVSQGDRRLNWIAGFFYLDFDRDQATTEFTPGYDTFVGVSVVNATEFFQLQLEQLEEWAVFGEIGYDFTDRWQATFGARYFDVEDTFGQETALPICSAADFGCDPFPPPPDGSPVSAYVIATTGPPQSFDDTVLKINTSFDFTDNLLGYITWSEGYRDGGSNGLVDCATVGGVQQLCGTADELGFGPDFVTNWELGVKSVWLDNSLVFNGSLFFIEWEDVQVGETSAGGALPITINGNDAESKGVELGLDWQIGDNWMIRTGYSYTEAELSQDAPQLANGTASAGDRLPGSPEHQGSLLVNYLRTLRNGLDLNISYGLTTQSDVYTKLGIGSGCCRIDNGAFSGQGQVLPGFTLHNAAIAIASEQWELMLFVDNLTSKYAETGVKNDPSMLVSSAQSLPFTYRRHAKYAVMPRSIGLDFRWRTR
ncbi:MAG: TonB-dependent receptor [Gammaproteobacteria bacterium]|nr:TonB-dependent receptor [Gammaproteobacteria bacterium]